MEFQRQISRKLYEEHIAVIGLLERFGQALAGLKAQQPPAASDALWSVLLAQLGSALQYEITRHFALEEDQLFPLLRARGEGELAELLLEEHEAVREVAHPLLELVSRARLGDLDAAGWRSLKANGLELVERLTSHAQKEQGALVPLVDEMLDEQTDDTLWNEYAS
jgi:hemerythrin-like domain-containing protein